MPHQPATFALPKSQFGKSKLVGFTHGLDYIIMRLPIVPFCFICAKAIREKMSSGNADTAFVSNRDRDYSWILWHIFIVLFNISMYKRSNTARL